MSQLTLSASFEYLCYGVNDHYKYSYFYSAGIDFNRQNLTSTDVRFWRLRDSEKQAHAAQLLNEAFSSARYFWKNKLKAATWDEHFQFCPYWKFNLYEAI